MRISKREFVAFLFVFILSVQSGLGMQPGFSELDRNTADEPAINVSADTTSADTTERYLKITTTEGETYRGRVLREDTVKIVLQLQAGEISVNKQEIKKTEIYDPRDESSLWFTNPNANRMFVMPTARMMKTGDGYYQNMYVLVSSISVGLADFLTGSVGVSMIPGIGFDNNLAFGSLKAGTRLMDNFHGAAGVTFLNVANEQSTFTYGMMTYGTTNQQLSVGYGAGLGDGGISGQDDMFIVGGQIRVSENIAFASENWLGREQILSYGIRFIGESVSADLAFFRVLEEDVNIGGLGIPYVDFIYSF